MVASSLLLVACFVAAVSGDAAVADDECSLMHQTRVVRQSVDRVMSFTEFIVQHGRTYVPGSDEYRMRAPLFETRAAMVRELNGDTNRLWTAGINKLTDRTSDELKALRGYNRHHRASSAAGGATSGSASSAVAFTEFEPQQKQHRIPRPSWLHFSPKHKHFEHEHRAENNEAKLMAKTNETSLMAGKHKSEKNIAKGKIEVPADLDWGSMLSSLSQVRDQGGCGSCWAFAAGTVIRAQSEIHSSRRDISYEEIVACVPNPDHCGGDGGCTGATVELAMDYIVNFGLYTETDFPYSATDAECPADRQAEMQQSSLVQRDAVKRGEAWGLVGWTRLPENELQPVKEALVQNGPLGIAIMVGDYFQMYMSGILPACQPEAIINHAVTLVGFGEDEATSTKFWRIQNSWGADWGENGYIRVFRHDDEAENNFCGWDDQPEVGSGCLGGPDKMWVCGTCGILNDVVSPVFASDSGHGKTSR